LDRLLPIQRQNKGAIREISELKPTAAALPRAGEKLVKGRYGSMMP
jgi:hypothetical protein